jgi:fucose permease
MSDLILLLLIYLLYASVGLADSLTGASWPAIRQEMGFMLSSAGVISLAMTSSNMVSCFCSGLLLRRIKTRALMLIGVCLMVVSLVMFYFSHLFFWMVLAAVPLGFGRGIIETGVNHFVSENYRLRHMTWLHFSGASAHPHARCLSPLFWLQEHGDPGILRLHTRFLLWPHCFR